MTDRALELDLFGEGLLCDATAQDDGGDQDRQTLDRVESCHPSLIGQVSFNSASPALPHYCRDGEDHAGGNREYPPVSARTEPTRNLLILHTPVRQDISDWLQVKDLINKRAPDIEARIATNGARNSVTSRWQVSRPSLVFSPFTLLEYKPKSGTVYAGRGFSKLEQMERLSHQGRPVPRTAKLTRDLEVDQALWGHYGVAKPSRGGMGRNVYLVPTGELHARYGALTLNGAREMIVQPYIEHSEDGYPTENDRAALYRAQ